VLILKAGNTESAYTEEIAHYVDAEYGRSIIKSRYTYMGEQIHVLFIKNDILHTGCSIN